MAIDAEMVRKVCRERGIRSCRWPDCDCRAGSEGFQGMLTALIAAARAEGMEAAAKVADDIHHAHARAEREARAAQDYGRSELLSAMAIGSSAAGAAIRGGSHGE